MDEQLSHNIRFFFPDGCQHSEISPIETITVPVTVPPPQCEKGVRLIYPSDTPDLCFKDHCVSVVVNLPWGKLTKEEVEQLSDQEILDKVKGILKRK